MATQARFYSATAQPTVLVGGITNSQTTIQVVAVTGFPASVPYILALDYNTPSEEIVLVTAAAGTTLTVTRAYDGTSGTSHNTGAGVRHTWTAKDGNDSRAHEASSQGVHGLAPLSSVVGTIDTQTLTNKTLVSPTITGATSIGNPNITGTVAGNATYLSPTIQADPLLNYGSIFKRRDLAQTGALASFQDQTSTEVSSVGVDGVPHWKAGEKAGSSDQFQVSAAGAVSTTSTISGAGISSTTTVSATGAITGASLQATAMASNYTSTSTATGVLSNTSYATQTPNITVTCIAPPSGKVNVSGLVRQDANAGHFTASAIQLSGSVSGVITAASDMLAVVNGVTSSYSAMSASTTYDATCSPGETLTAVWQHKTDSAGGFYTIYGKNLSIKPLIG